jgi:hypothetical protein
MNGIDIIVQPGIAMTRGSILRFEDGRDLLIHVWEGALWLTQERDGRDRYLGAGDSFRLDRQGVAIAHATRRAVVSIAAPDEDLYAKRVSLSRAGSEMPVELYSAARANASLGVRLRRLWADLSNLGGRNASSSAAP